MDKSLSPESRTPSCRDGDAFRTPPVSPSKRRKLMHCPAKTLDTIKSTAPRDIRTSVEDTPEYIVNKISFELNVQGVPVNEFFLITPDQVHKGRQHQLPAEKPPTRRDFDFQSPFRLQYRQSPDSASALTRSVSIDLDDRSRSLEIEHILFQPASNRSQSGNIYVPKS